MSNSSSAIRPTKAGLLCTAAFMLAVFLACPTGQAKAMDWTGVTSGNLGDWTGEAGASTASATDNFFYKYNANGNVLTVRNPNTAGGGVPAQIAGAIYGGFSSNPNSTNKINTAAASVDGNLVTVFSSAALSGNVDVYGGYKYASNNRPDAGQTLSVNANTVIIHSGVNLGTGTVAGGWLEGRGSSSADFAAITLQQMRGNKVIIYGGTMRRIGGAVADTIAPALAALEDNSVRIDLTGGGSLTIKKAGGSDPSDGNIYGADFRSGNVINNSVTLIADNSSAIESIYSIFGGRSGFYKGQAAGNAVLIDLSKKSTPTTAFGDITGGSSGSESGYAGGEVIGLGQNEAYGNSVEIYGNSAAPLTASSVAGGKVFNGNASYNSVYISDAAITGSRIESLTVTAPVAVSGGRVEHSTLAAGAGNIGVADNNSVTIVRGRIAGDIYGGLDGSGAVNAKSASGNSLAITDTVIGSAAVYGGYSLGQAINNAVHIAGYGTSFTDPAVLLAGGNREITGNTLTTTTAVNMRVGRIENFENYVFNMTGNEMDKTVYSVGAPVNFTGTSHTLNFDATVGPPLHPGQVLTLIDTTTGGGALPQDKFVKNIRDGFLYNYEGYFGMDEAGDALIFEITAREEDERNITFGQSQLVGLQMVNIASDLARSIHRMYDIRCSAECYDTPGANPCAEQRGSGLVTFFGTQGGSHYWNTGNDSRVNLDFFSMLAGLGWRNEGLLVAGFFETGFGQYDAKVSGAKIVNGDDTKYTGAGALIRYERNNTYGEAGIHAGRVHTDFDSLEFGTEAQPVHVEYENKSTYLGIDALAGYKLDVDCSTFDFSVRYSWNHLKSDDFTAHGARFNQGSADSHRIRSGVEWSYSKNDIHPYAGAFYEYESDTESEHEVFGEEIRHASRGGSSGIGKLGFRFGGGERRLSFDIGVEGQLGDHRGVTGRAMLGYAF